MLANTMFALNVGRGVTFSIDIVKIGGKIHDFISIVAKRKITAKQSNSFVEREQKW